MSRYLDPRSALLAAYNTYWDTVSTEKTLLSERFQQGQDQGKLEGKLESNIEILLLLLRQKFKIIPDIYRHRVETATFSDLQKWLNRVLHSSKIDEVFKEEIPA